MRTSRVSVLRRPILEFQEHRLENGLQVLLYRDSRCPLVHVSVHYRVGSSYEKPGYSGFAHLFEHMMFQGSANLGKNEHGKYIDQAGGHWNASTNKDRTNYYETVPSHYLDLALWLEAERMSSLKVTLENFENQRQTVSEEKKQHYDNRPYGLASLRFDELAYDNWAYGHPIIGSVEDLQRMTWQDALEFHRTYYSPGRAILVLSGDLDEKAAWEKVRAHFEAIPDHRPVLEPELGEPEQKSQKREVMRDPLAVLPAITMGYHMPPLGSPEYYALSVLSAALSHGESSRLYRRLVYFNNWVTALSTGPNEYKGPELFDLSFQLQAGVDVSTVLAAVEDELNRVCEEAISEGELEKAKNQITYAFLSRLSTVAQIGERLARYTVYFDDPSLINSELDRFLCVSTRDILQAARVFAPENRTLLVVEP